MVWVAFSTLAEYSESGTVSILGIRFHRLSGAQVIEQLLFWISERSHRMMITAGPEFVMKALEDGQLFKIAKSADIVTPDGIGVLWAARRTGQVLNERVTGVEVTIGLLETANQRKQALRVYIIGASPEVLETCLRQFGSQFPYCEFRGHHGYFTEDEWPSLLEDIQSFAPNLWIVGMGQPRQEKLIFDNLKHIPPCVAVGVGGSIDVWSGTVARAPYLFRKLNVEWLYRLLRQPSRWRRQLALPRFAWQVLKNAAKGT
jgi:N-acetylglucosaminyldiphosphoundecaprenol N-acetyl-beta-D-mannosaminyltransferase